MVLLLCYSNLHDQGFSTRIECTIVNVIGCLTMEYELYLVVNQKSRAPPIKVGRLTDSP